MSQTISLDDNESVISINRRVPEGLLHYVLDYRNISDGSTFTGLVTQFTQSGNWVNLTIPRAEAPPFPGQYTVEIIDTVEDFAHWDTTNNTWDESEGDPLWDDISDGVRNDIVANELFILTVENTQTIYESNRESNNRSAYLSTNETNLSATYLSDGESNAGAEYVSNKEDNDSRAYISNGDSANFKTNR